MDAFFRGLALFIFGVLVGAAGILFFTPSFDVVVSRHPGSLKLIELGDAELTPVAQAEVRPAAPSPSVVPPKPIPVAEVRPVVPAVPNPPAAISATEPVLDFKSISEHLILWPTSVTVKTATAVPVLVDGKKAQDLVLEAGTILQVSKVLADGSLEARAKGAKFEIKSSLTDFAVELGKRVSELVAKGTKFDSPYPSLAAPVTTTMTNPSATVPAPVPAPVVAAVVTPKAPLTLAQRVDVLFGAKPAEPVVPVAPAVVAPAMSPVVVPPPAQVAPAAVVEVVPAPGAEPKAAEKGKDLDRKMNQLFR